MTLYKLSDNLYNVISIRADYRPMIERTIYPELLAHLAAKEITVLIGARQVGKTTLTKKLKAAADRDGVRTLYLNLDITTDARYLDTQAMLLQKIRLEFGTEYGIVFIDEIQRRKNAGRFLKGLYDQDLPIKFVVTGSGSLELKAAVAESLVGRKRVFPIHPLSFVEFFHHKTDQQVLGAGSPVRRGGV